eukprot:m.207202 g.207202  ORF g.207202 m.207202 type:complete len:1116 (-) comp13761_c1_seq1:3267-6614(-)
MAFQQWATTKDRRHVLECNFIDIDAGDPQAVTDFECFFGGVDSVDDITSLLPNLKTLKILIDPAIYDLKGIEKSKKLEELWVAECSLASLDSIALLTELRKLVLYANQLTTLANIGRLENLTTLNFSSNDIEDLTPITALKSLVSVDASRNRITLLPSALKNLNALKAFDLSGNRISNFSSLSALCDIQSLREVIFQGKDAAANPICELDNYFVWVKSLLPQVEKIDEIVLANNPLHKTVYKDLDEMRLNTVTKMQQLHSSAWVWSQDYLKSIYSMRNHFIKDYQVRIAATKAFTPASQEDQEEINSYLEQVKQRTIEADEHFKERIYHLMAPEQLYEWRVHLVNALMRVCDTGYVEVFPIQITPILYGQTISPQPPSSHLPSPSHHVPPPTSSTDEFKELFQGFFLPDKLKELDIGACRIHHALQVSNHHLHRQHNQDVQRFLQQCAKEQLLSSETLDQRQLPTSTGGNVDISYGLHALKKMDVPNSLEFTDVTPKQGRNGKTTTTSAVVYRPSQLEVAQLLTNVDDCFRYFIVDIDDDVFEKAMSTASAMANDDSDGHSDSDGEGFGLLESAFQNALDQAIVDACITPHSSLSSNTLASHIHLLDFVSEKKWQAIRKDPSWPPSSFSRLLVVRAFHPGLIWESQKSESNMSCSEALSLWKETFLSKSRSSSSTSSTSSLPNKKKPSSSKRNSKKDANKQQKNASDLVFTFEDNVKGDSGVDVEKEACYSNIDSQYAWFEPMYILDIEYCERSLKIESLSKDHLHVPKSVHRNWENRKKLSHVLQSQLTKHFVRASKSSNIFAGVQLNSCTRINFSGLNLKSVSPLKYLPALEHLNMSYNNIASLDWCQGLNKLVSLDVYHNRVTTVNLPNTPSLQFLDIGANSITRGVALSHLSSSCPNLVVLLVNDNPILEDDVYGTLEKVVSGCSKLALVSMQWNVSYYVNKLEAMLSHGSDTALQAVTPSPSKTTIISSAAMRVVCKIIVSPIFKRKQPHVRAFFTEDVHGNTRASATSYTNANPWQSYRIQPELNVCDCCTDSSYLKLRRDQASKVELSMRRPSCFDQPGVHFNPDPVIAFEGEGGDSTDGSTEEESDKSLVQSSVSSQQEDVGVGETP